MIWRTAEPWSVVSYGLCICHKAQVVVAHMTIIRTTARCNAGLR